VFNDLVESVDAKKKTHKTWSVMISVVFQSAWLIILILIPLIHTLALPKAILSTVLVAPGAPRTSSPLADAKLPKSAPRTIRLLNGNVLHAPSVIPSTVSMMAETELPPDSSANASPLLNFDLVRDSTSTAIPAPPSTPQSNSAKAATRIKLGGQVQAAKIILQPQPVYPALARQARIQGTVVLHAIIGTDGRVNELLVISGHPLLVQAALDSVKQWRYQPTLLNNQPVEVDTTITVSFVLGG
jgi:periplasmic protein TonB